MGATLRVDPDRLRTAARAQADVGTAVSGLAAGTTVTTAGTGMAGLAVEEACRVAGGLFDTATTAVHDELTEHSEKLSAAADQYHHMDAELSRRVRTLTSG
jgi:hypothetical protein